MNRLEIISASASNSASGGIVLDAISVTAIPEPSALTSLFAGLFLLFQRRRSGSDLNQKVGPDIQHIINKLTLSYINWLDPEADWAYREYDRSKIYVVIDYG